MSKADEFLSARGHEVSVPDEPEAHVILTVSGEDWAEITRLAPLVLQGPVISDPEGTWHRRAKQLAQQVMLLTQRQVSECPDEDACPVHGRDNPLPPRPPADLGRAIVQALKAYEKSGGWPWRTV